MNNGVYSMNKTMEMYSPSHKKRVMAEVVEGYAQNGKGGSPRLALKGLFEGKKTLPKKVNTETFEKYGFNAEETIAAFHAENVGEPLPESPLEDAPSDTPSPIEPTNANFSADGATQYRESLRNRDGINRVYCLVCNKLYKSKDGSPIGFTMRNCCGQETETDPNKIDFLVNYKNKDKKNAEDSPSPSGPSEEPEPAEATGSEPSNENFSAESAFDKLEDEVAEEFGGETNCSCGERFINQCYLCDTQICAYCNYNNSAKCDKCYEGDDSHWAEEFGAEQTQYDVKKGKYGKKVMTEAAKKGVSAKSLVKNTESEYEESYDDFLDEMGEAAISNYSVSWLLEQADPIAYQVGLNDYESFMLSEHEDDASMYSEWFDEDGDLTRKGEQEIPAIYDESLDEMGTEWLANKYNASWLLKRGDPIAYRVGLSDYESSMEEDFDTESFNTEEPIVEEPAWIPAGDGRALGQQNFGINMSPLHAESFSAENKKPFIVYGEYKNGQRIKLGESATARGAERIVKNKENAGILNFDKYESYGFENANDYYFNEGAYNAESQESMILEACGICDKDFASETLNADGYCGSCCDSRLAEFETHEYEWDEVCQECGDVPCKCFDDFSAETDDEGRTAPNECPTCGEDTNWATLTHGESGSWDCHYCGTLTYDAESKGISKNAQIALGLTALGVGIAVWKSNDILNLFNKFRGE